RQLVVAPGERRRLEEPDHPSGQHDAPAAGRRGAARGGRRTRYDPPVGGHRSGRRSDLGSRTGVRAGCRGGDERGGFAMSPSFDLSRYQDPLTIQRVIHSAKTIAIVGLSKNQMRASNFVGFYLRRHGYRVIPVNPRESDVLGEKSYKTLTDVPGRIDVVN